LGISPDGEYLIYDLRDSVVRVINYQNHSSDSIKLMWNHIYNSSICFSPSNNKYMIVGTSDNNFHEFGMFNINSGIKLFSFFDSTTANLGLEASKDSHYVLSVSAKRLRLFNIDWNTTSIQDYNRDNPKYLYPNPSTGDINIPIEDNIQASQIDLYDIEGNLIKTFLINPSINSTYLISNNEILSGSYLIHVKTGLLNKSYKVIINK
jgi:hypothetical protein